MENDKGPKLHDITLQIKKISPEVNAVKIKYMFTARAHNLWQNHNI
jgi:hypothetical protein